MTTLLTSCKRMWGASPFKYSDARAAHQQVPWRARLSVQPALYICLDFATRV
jgi:hypothetical protein